MAKKMAYIIKGKKLLLPNGDVVNIGNPITKVEPFGKMLVVYFDRKTKRKGGSNVCGVDPKSGEIIWRLSGKQRVSGKKLLLEDGVVVAFKEPITQAETFDEVLVVLFNQQKPNPESDSEICGVDAKTGEILWRMKGKQNDSYTDLRRRGKSTALAFSWMGIVDEIDPVTGKIKGQFWIK